MSEPVIFPLLKNMVDRGASDLYLTVNHPPTIRVEGEVVSLSDKKLSLDDLNEMVNSVLTSRQRREFGETMEMNTSLDMNNFGRFRVNVMRQRQAPAMVIRRIISKIPTFDELNLPNTLEALALEKRGLVLVSGMTGSGKSTTLASMINHRNINEAGHIITIEDPIEYYHEHKKSVVTQREVGVDTESFHIAMKNSLRQRPDVILIGEIRDRDAMEQALSISETGHLCLATIHTNNAYQAIERIVNLFPDEFHRQVRLNLSLNLKAIVSQRLLPAKDGGQTPAIEVMLNQGLVRELILKGEIEKIGEVMEQSKALGMRTFDQSLMDLFVKGLITEETAITNSDKPSDMKIKVEQVKMQGKTGEPDKVFEALDTSLISLKD